MTITDVLSGAKRWHLAHGDCRELLKALPDNCIDACVTDPPYELSNDGKASAARVALEMLFPQQANLKAASSGEDDLPFLVEKVLGLCGINLVPGPSTSVPIVPMTLNNQSPTWENDVEDGDVAPAAVTESNGAVDSKTEPEEHLGDFALELADAAAALNAFNSAGCGFASGGVGIGFRMTPSGLPGLLGGSRVVDRSDDVVRVRDGALTQCIGALGRAEELPIARFQFARGSVDELSAHGALMILAVLLSCPAKLVRAATAARGLPTKFEARRIRIVAPGAGRTLTLNLLMHPASVSSTGFMGKDWDGSKVAFDVEMWREIYRVLKPGGHVLAFGGTRTYHRLASAIEDAGFVIRDQLSWIYGQGFPKGTNISKAIDRKAGAKREVVGQRLLTGNAAQTTKEKGGTYASGTDSRGVAPKLVDVTAPSTEEAKRWEGWGTGLKPAHEPIAMAMKPLDDTFEANVRRWGTGAINVDACRIGSDEIDTGHTKYGGTAGWSGNSRTGETSGHQGRWPANRIFSHAADCHLVGSRKVKAAPAWNDNRPPSSFTGSETSPVHHAGDDGTETVEDWRCAPWCPVAVLDEQAGERTSGAWDGQRASSKVEGVFNQFAGTSAERPRARNSGGASRYFTQFPYEPFFYEPKATTAERETGVEWMPDETVGDGRHTANDTPYQRGKKARKNTHATVKPVAVTRWLSRLICPPGGLILDPFAGSGTGGIAATAEGFRWLGFELLAKHVEIARARIIGDAPLFNRQEAP